MSTGLSSPKTTTIEIMSTRLSLEFFPPHKPEQDSALVDLISKHQELEFVSITHTRGRFDRTLDVVDALSYGTTLPLAPHIVARRTKQADFEQVMRDLRERNIERLVVISGDVAADDGGQFADSLDFLSQLKRHGQTFTEICVGGYPEAHYSEGSSRNMSKDVDILLRKQELGATRVITQLFYELGPFLTFRDLCARHRLELPITAGLLPIGDATKVRGFCARTGVHFPSIDKDFASKEDESAAYRDMMLGLLHELNAEGIDSFHLYTLNGEAPTLPLAREIRQFKPS